MTNAIKTFVLALLFAAPLTSMAENQKAKDGNRGNTVDEVLVILSSDSLQTQGMAMVLSNTMAQKGAKVNVLLCDEAGDLALKAYEAEPLAAEKRHSGADVARAYESRWCGECLCAVSTQQRVQQRRSA